MLQAPKQTRLQRQYHAVDGMLIFTPGVNPGGGLGGSDEPPLAPKITYSMCLSDLL